MTIKEIEERTGMDRANIRFYEKEGLLFPQRLANGYRDYTEHDVDILLRVKLLRSLHVPLDEIRALQSGEKTLSAAIQMHLHTLESEAVAVAAAENVCRTMQHDHADYATLNAEKYLLQLQSEPQVLKSPRLSIPKEDVAPHPAHPWRRLFARTLDYDLYALPLELLCLLVFRLNPSSSGGKLMSSVCIFIAYLMMLFIEPALLHFFGTTPGKWIFGLRITQTDGTHLSYEDGLQRTWNVIRYGEGFGVPIYTLYRNWKCYKLCITDELCPWDEYPPRRLYTIHDTKAWRGIVWFVIVTLLVLINQGARSFSVLPPNRGELTVTQFAENFNYLRDYYDSGPLGAEHTYTLGETGEWQYLAPPNGEYVYVSEVPGLRDPVPFEYFTDENGYLIGLRISNNNEDYWDMMDLDDLEFAALAFITAQSENTLFSRTGKRVSDKIASATLADTVFTEAGVTVSYHITYSSDRFLYEFIMTKS